MTKIKILLIIAICLAIGLLICPKPPRIDGSYLLTRVLEAEYTVPYTALQDQMCVMYGREIRTKVHRHSVTKVRNPELERLIKKNYTPLVEGKDKIAGRECWILRLKPKAKQMPWKQLWVDKKTFIVLASRDWTAYNKIKRSMKSISISYSSPKTAQNSAHQKKNPIALNENRPKYIPNGFKLISSTDKKQVYSDGLYNISICFYIPNSIKCPNYKAVDWGQGLIYVISHNGKRIAIIADLTDKEITRIAASIPQ